MCCAYYGQMARKINASVDNHKEIKGVTPDEFDEKNIRNLLEMWDKVHPRGKYVWHPDKDDPNRKFIEYLNPYDHIAYMRTVVKKERKLHTVRKKNTDPTWLRTSLPPTFAAELRKAYPTLLSDKKQCNWFLSKFPEFKLGE